MKLIYKVKGAYSKASCKKLIKWFENNKHLSKPGAGGENTVLNNLEIPIQIKTDMCFFNLGKILTTSIEKFGWSHFHTGVKAPKETKYILTGWCSYII